MTPEAILIVGLAAFWIASLLFAWAAAKVDERDGHKGEDDD